MDASHTIQGAYLESCQKRADATEPLAAAQLRLLKARGRTEQSYYRCDGCGMFHLSGRPPGKTYRMEATNVVHVGATRIGISRKVRPDGTTIGMCIMFTAKDGTEKKSIYNMTPEQGRAMLDAFIEAVYDNTEADTQGTERKESAA